MYQHELRIHKHALKESMVPAPNTSKTADMEKGDIRITQIDDEVKVLGVGRLQ